MKDNQKTRQEIQADARVDEALEESFPASDAPSYNRGLEAPPRRSRNVTESDEVKWTADGQEPAMNTEERHITSSVAYLIGGLAVGVVCGLLFAPKKGSELIADIKDWGRDKREEGQKFYSRAKEYIPHRNKNGDSA